MDLSSHIWTIVHILSAFVLVGHILSIGILGAFAYEQISGNTTILLKWITKNALVLMLVVALVASIGSLFLSEIAGWTPCKFCWIQRIFMYPQVILLAIALWKRDRSVARYILALSVIGLAYASYHYYIQLYDIIASPTNPATPCDASGESCVKTPFMHFGYITIPMMAWTAFLLNILGSTLLLRKYR